MGAVEAFLVFALLSAPLALLVYALFDASKYAEKTWETAGKTRMIWMAMILVFGCIGPILYLTMVRPRLREIEPDAAATDLDPGNDDPATDNPNSR